MALGALAALPGAINGLSDWADSYVEERRVGLVHAAANVAGLGLFALSLGTGRRARRLRLLGLVAVGAGGYLGGHLSYARGLGVDHQVFLDKPAEWTDAIAEERLEEATLTVAEAGGARVLPTGAAPRSTPSPTSAPTPPGRSTRARSTRSSA